MKPDIKEKWLKSLRSGEYQQCDGQLNSGHGFCCLGVLTDIYIKEKNLSWDKEDSGLTFKGESEGLKPEIQNWSGLESRLPEIGIEEVESEDTLYPTGSLISELNDDGFSFSELAELIEKEF